jgi:hypothetical protein
MINTTGIQSTGPQGLPESSSLPAIANAQDEAQFNAVMADPKNASSLDELAKQLTIASENLKAAQNTGDQKQISEAVSNFSQANRNYRSGLEAITGIILP